MSSTTQDQVDKTIEDAARLMDEKAHKKYKEMKKEYTLENAISEANKGVDHIIHSGPEELGKYLRKAFLDKVNDQAKNVVTRTLDYIFSVILILIQSLHCNVSALHHYQALSFEEAEAAVEDALNDIGSMASSFFHCADVNIKKYTYLPYLAFGIMVYPLVASIIIWVHSAREGKDQASTKKSTVGNIYKWTDRIPIFDSLIEIFIALYVDWKTTLFLWTMYGGSLMALIFINVDYVDTFTSVDDSAFLWSLLLVAYNLYRINGDISQYWVLHAVNSNTSGEERKEQEDRSSLIEERI